MRTTMPSETVTGVVGSLIGAAVGIAAAYGLEVPAGAVAGIITIVSWMAFAVTLWVRARRVSQGRMAARTARPRG